MSKVSIIIPCFNGEKFLKRCLDSILNQTYKNIEIIFINDGSTDQTNKVVQLYIKKFNRVSINFKYINQKKNYGQAQAVNRAIKIFEGDYLVFLDSDDFINYNYLKKMVSFLDDNKEYGMVRCSFCMYKEDDLKIPYKYISYDRDYSENIFEGIILGKVRCSNGSYMIRSSAFLETNPHREIYISKSGQNFQILLPIAYKYKCGYMHEHLFNCVVRKNSHSRSLIYKGKEGEIKRSYEIEDILINTVKK